MPSSGGQFWGWCPRSENLGPPRHPGMSLRHPSSSSGVGARPSWGLAPGCPSAPLQSEVWRSFPGSARDHTRMGLGPRMWNTRETPPLPERIGCVARPAPRSRTPCHFRPCHDLGQRATLDRETLDVESPIPQIFANRPEEARRNQMSCW